MSNLLFAEYPDIDNPRGLLLVQTKDMPTYLHPSHADAIDQALAITGIDSKEARFLSAMHRTGIIPRSLLHDAISSLDALDPADDLLKVLLDKEDEGILPNSTTYTKTAEAVCAHQTGDYTELMIASPDGLDVIEYDSANRPVINVQEIRQGDFEEDEHALANEQRLTHYGFQHKLIWTQGSDGEWKYLKFPGGSCYLLGTLSINKTFEPVVTLLGENYQFGTQPSTE